MINATHAILLCSISSVRWNNSLYLFFLLFFHRIWYLLYTHALSKPSFSKLVTIINKTVPTINSYNISTNEVSRFIILLFFQGHTWIMSHYRLFWKFHSSKQKRKRITSTIIFSFLFNLNCIISKEKVNYIIHQITF